MPSDVWTASLSRCPMLADALVSRNSAHDTRVVANRKDRTMRRGAVRDAKRSQHYGPACGSGQQQERHLEDATMRTWGRDAKARQSVGFQPTFRRRAPQDSKLPT